LGAVLDGVEKIWEGEEGSSVENYARQESMGEEKIKN